jgi:cupin 2 domain-containing protein
MVDPVRLRNIFKDIPENLPEELIEKITEGRSVKIERIVSKGHSSPPGFWYDQDKNEFVILIAGRAGLVVEGRKDPLTMEAGDYINLPAHLKHRVEWTDRHHDTVWLAVHY